MTETNTQTPHRWWLWANRFLLFLGAALILAGIVFFFAFNWHKMASSLKFGLVQGLVLVSLIAVFKFGMETITGKIFLLAASLMVGVFLAVYGQIYQTGADAYELFVGWAILIFGWVALSKFAALWLMWLTIVDTAVILYWNQVLEPNKISNINWLFLLLAAINTVFLVLAHWGRSRKIDWLNYAWYNRLLLASVLFWLTIPSIEFVAGERNALVFPLLALLLALPAVYYFYRVREPDLASLTLGTLSACAVLLTAIGRFLLKREWEPGNYFVFGLIVIGVFSVTTYWLMQTHKKINPSKPKEPEEEAADAPWYIKVLIGIGAWVSALFFILFLGISRMLKFNNEGAMLIWGLSIIAAAVLLHKFGKNIYLSQLALALSVAGHILVMIGAGQLGGRMISTGGIFLASVILCIPLYYLYTNSLHRFLSCLLALGMAVVFILDSKLHHGLHLLALVELLAIGLILTKSTKAWTKIQEVKKWQPLFYALNLAVPLLYFLVLMPRREIRTLWWPSNILLVLALVWLYFHIRKEESGSAEPRGPGSEPLLFGAVATVLLGVLSTPGLLAAAAVLILGYHLSDKALTGLGLALLPTFIIIFYYNLNMRLDVKSGILAASGLILLGMRWYLGKRPRAKGDVQ